MTRRLRTLTVLGLVVVLIGIIVITFWPTPVDQPVHQDIAGALTDLHRVGVLRQVDYSFVEFSANVAMFLPFGALIALLAMPSLWWLSGVFGLALSLCVELGQYLLLPHRFASPYDLASNTAGALLAGIIVASFRAANRRHRRRWEMK